MTAVFENDQIQFMYPENWTLTENTETSDFFEVSLESPEGNIWSVSVFPSGTDLNGLVEHCAEALRDQYQDFERTDFVGELGHRPALGFDADFYCLDFLVTASARVVQCSGKCLNFFCQAESREFDKNSKVFDAISLSLLNALDDSTTL